VNRALGGSRQFEEYWP